MAGLPIKYMFIQKYSAGLPIRYMFIQKYSGTVYPWLASLLSTCLYRSIRLASLLGTCLYRSIRVQCTHGWPPYLFMFIQKFKYTVYYGFTIKYMFKQKFRGTVYSGLSFKYIHFYISSSLQERVLKTSFHYIGLYF